MKQILSIVIVLLFTSPLVPAQNSGGASKQPTNLEQELMRLETEFYEAYTKGDAATIERLLAEDYTHNDIRGGFKSRAAYMMYINALSDSIKSGAMKIDSSNLDDLRVRVYGDTAVVTGRWSARGQRGGKEDSEQLRFVNVWVKQNGRWQAVAGQVTLAPR